MLVAAVSAAFALICGAIARRAFPRGLQFILSGWSLVQAYAADPDRRQLPENRQGISQGGTLLVAGLLWTLGGLVAAVFAVYFVVQAVRYGLPAAA